MRSWGPSLQPPAKAEAAVAASQVICCYWRGERVTVVFVGSWEDRCCEMRAALLLQRHRSPRAGAP